MEDELHTALEERERVNSELQLSIRQSSSVKVGIAQCLSIELHTNVAGKGMALVKPSSQYDARVSVGSDQFQVL